MLLIIITTFDNALPFAHGNKNMSKWLCKLDDADKSEIRFVNMWFMLVSVVDENKEVVGY